MKRILLSVLALSLVLSGSAFATVRTNGMAIDQDDTMDYGNIYAFPQLTGKYANILRAVPTGAGWSTNGELLINAGDKTITVGYGSGNVSFLQGFEDWNSAANYVGWTGGTYVGVSDPDQKLQLGLALPMGSGLLGARFSWSRVRHNYTDIFTDDAAVTHTDYEEEDKASQIKIEAGYGMEDAGPFKSVDLGVALAINSGEGWTEDRDTDNDPNTTELAAREGAQTDGATDINVRLRGVKEQGDGSLVFNVGFRTGTLNSEYFQQIDADLSGDYQDNGADTDSTYRSEEKGTILEVGVAYNKPINDGGLLVISAHLTSLSHTRTDSETFFDFASGETKSGATDDVYKNTQLYVPLAVGVEDKLGDNLKGRLGVKKNVLLSSKDESTYGSDYDIVADTLNDTEVETFTDVNNEDATLYMGLSATKGKFYSDWVISHDIFWNGPNFLFGSSSNFAAEWEVGLTF